MKNPSITPPSLSSRPASHCPSPWACFSPLEGQSGSESGDMLACLGLSLPRTNSPWMPGLQLPTWPQFPSTCWGRPHLCELGHGRAPAALLTPFGPRGSPGCSPHSHPHHCLPLPWLTTYQCHPAVPWSPFLCLAHCGGGGLRAGEHPVRAPNTAAPNVILSPCPQPYGRSWLHVQGPGVRSSRVGKATAGGGRFFLA